MIKLANFTQHDQQEHVFKWKSFDFAFDPKQRAPLINFETEEWTEETILDAVINELEHIKAGGFSAILIGGYNSCSVYAWMLAVKYQLRVVMARMSSDGTLVGFSFLPSPSQVFNYPWLRSFE